MKRIGASKDIQMNFFQEKTRFIDSKINEFNRVCDGHQICQKYNLWKRLGYIFILI